MKSGGWRRSLGGGGYGLRACRAISAIFHLMTGCSARGFPNVFRFIAYLK